MVTTRSPERIEQNARSESICRGEEAKFAGWNGRGGGGAEKRGNEGVKLASVRVRRNLYTDGYGCIGREGVKVGSQ